MWSLTVSLLVSSACFTIVNSFWFLSYGPNLESYNVDRDAVSVSGISSGAAMAVQYHTALSSQIMGLGIIAGVPYGCAGIAGMTAALCMTVPSLVDTNLLIALTNTASSVGTIDDTTNMQNDKVFIYNSPADSVVNYGIGEKLLEYYNNFILNPNNIQTKFDLASEHGVPTLNYGAPCGQLGGQFLNNCGYSVAFHILNHIYGGNLQEPTASTVQSGQLLEFDQNDFFYLNYPSAYSMDFVGYVYIPSGCEDRNTECKLHIAFHGCLQGREAEVSTGGQVGDAFATHAGYNEVGELNNIIILYPQALLTVSNPTNCWDWFGYTGINYGIKDGFQITAVRRMMEKVMDL